MYGDMHVSSARAMAMENALATTSAAIAD